MDDTATISETLLLAILAEHPDGIDEYDLISALRSAACPAIPKTFVGDHMALFQTHFRVRNALYRLREQLWQEQRGHLQIGLLRVTLQPYQPGDAALTEADPLRDYYLDWQNLENITLDEVVELLNRFWSGFGARDKRQAALATLELQDPVDYTAIKQQYRRLAMRYHPDRGGDQQRLQELNAALAVLEDYYGKG